MPTGRVAIFGWSGSVHIRRWVRGMSAQGYEVKLISLGGEPLNDIETHIIPRRNRLTYVTRTRMAVAAARALKPDLVHAHYATGFGYWGLRTGHHPFLVSVWGADVVDFPRSWWRRAVIRKILRTADHISATSHYLKEATERLLPDVSDKTSVIPFGVELPETVSDEPPRPPVRLCFIKALRPKYGPDTLLRALARVRSSGHDVRLTLAGEGEMTVALKALTASLGLKDAVTFVGFIDNSQIARLLQEHHAMVMPSVSASESFGVAVLEAGASERAVVASNVGGVPEILIDGHNGLLVPPGDVDRLAEAIARVATNDDLRRQMGQRGRELVQEKYTWQRSLDMMTALYERLIHERKKQPYPTL